jgi:DNA polymerase III alpha subunit
LHQPRLLNSRVPTEPAALAERVVVQWDKDALAAVGLVKIDVLGLRMLSTLSETCDWWPRQQVRRWIWIRSLLLTPKSTK